MNDSDRTLAWRCSTSSWRGSGTDGIERVRPTIDHSPPLPTERRRFAYRRLHVLLRQEDSSGKPRHLGEVLWDSELSSGRPPVGSAARGARSPGPSLEDVPNEPSVKPPCSSIPSCANRYGRPGTSFQITPRPSSESDGRGRWGDANALWRGFGRVRLPPNFSTVFQVTAIRGKRKVDGERNETSGKPLDRGALYHLLQNRLYRAEISHKGLIHPGEHEAIVDEDLWSRVQTALAENRVERKLRSNAASPALLAGLVRDEAGVPMTPTHANKKGRRYRYYVSNDLIVGRKKDGDEEIGSGRGGACRIPAADLEAVVERSIRSFLADEVALYPLVAVADADPVRIRNTITELGTLTSRWTSLDRTGRISLYDRLIDGIAVRPEQVDIAIRPEALRDLADPAVEHLTVPARLKRVGMEMRLLFEVPHRGPVPKPDRSLLRLLGQAHRFREMLLRGDGSTIVELAEEAGGTPSWFARIVRLGFLSPRVVTAIVDGTQPLELSADRLLKAGPVSSAWSDQLATYGFV